VVLNIINGAVIHYDNQSFAIKRNNVAYVVDRERFDKELSFGLNIVYANKFLGLERDKNNGYIVDTDKGDYFADLVIGADGANSVTRKILNPANLDVHSFKGVQIRMRSKVKQDDYVRVYLKKDYFIWVVPEGSGIVRVGTISDNPYQDFQSFLKELKIEGDIIEKFGGVVSIGICPNTVKDNIALVGDAACQMKPLTYGGIYFGLKAADILGNCIKLGRLKDYDMLWKKELGFEIKIGLKIKDTYAKLDNDERQKVFKLLKDHKVLLEKFGDFENHSRFMLEIIRKPSLYPKLGELFRIVFKNVL
jgi:flavin-dependent dehydrogenase